MTVVLVLPVWPVASRTLAPRVCVRRLTSNGLVAWAEVLQAGFEGYVAKDEGSPYLEGVTKAWLKVKVQGWTDRRTGGSECG